MEGLEISEIKYLDLINHTISLRIDSEYFKKEYLLGDRLLKHKTCEKLVDITRRIDVGFVGSMTSYYRETGVILLQTKNISSFFVSDSDTIKITEEFHQELQKSQINFKDILIARSGSFGKASIYLEKETINSSDIIIIEAKEKAINPFYLTVFLNSKSGVDQMIRFASGGLQGHVNLTIIEELQVPVLENWFQKKVEEILWKSYLIKKESQDKYSSAETLLLETLGLSNFEPSQEPVNVKGFKESFLNTGRLDAEYYQKKYDEIELKILRSKNGSDILANQIEYIGTGEYSEEYQSKGLGLVPYIRNTNLGKGNIEVDEMFYVEPSNFKTSAKIGEILTSRVGTIGLFGVVKKQQENSVYSDNILAFKLKESFVPEVYALLFSTKFYQLLLEKLAGGSVQPLITQTSLKQLAIPFIEREVQQKILKLVEESFHLKKQSERLLETAKRAVEIAIEQNEDAALRYIEEQQKDAGGIVCL